MQNIIYELVCPILHKPVYVGQSTRGLDRPYEHIKEASHSEKVNEWVHGLKEIGLSPILVILEHTEHDSELKDKEKYWITKRLSEGHLLMNLKSITPAYFNSLEYDEESSDWILDIGRFLKYRRKLLKLTQKELSDKAGIALTIIRSLEQGSLKKGYSTRKLGYLLSFIGGRLVVLPNKTKY